ncbi:hypothetical protein [Alteromonas sp. 14N.309.X.WAT.G.H12]|uniref:hypothetical protein n=1 Tax=Alteromonas sp. 14N.309.X.WAT.G.H12 TaxID=3120824 RepID=UPI002FD74CD6
MPKYVSEGVIKRTVTQRLRRHNKTVARRVRLLPEAAFSRLTNHPQTSTPPPFESERAALVFKAKHFNDRYTSLSRLLSGDPPPSLVEIQRVLIERLASSQIRANSLLSSGQDSSLPLAAQHFLSVINLHHEHNELDALPFLARKLGSISQQDNLSGKETQSFIRRIEMCLEEADEVIDGVDLMLSQHPDVALFNSPGSAILSLPDDWAQFFSLKTLKRIFGIGDHDLMTVINNSFERGVAKTLYSSPIEQTLTTAAGLAFALSKDQLVLKEHDAYDALLNSDIKNNIFHPLQAINETLAAHQTVNAELPMKVNLADLDAINTLNIECRTAHDGLLDKQFDFFLTLNSEMSGVFSTRGSRRVLALESAPEQTPLLWHVSDKNNITLEISTSQLRALKKEKKDITFRLAQRAPGNFFFSQTLSTNASKRLHGHSEQIAFPDPNRDSRTKAVMAAIQPLKERGYLSQQYSKSSWHRTLSHIGNPDHLMQEGTDALGRLLDAVGAATFIDIQLHKESDSETLPYRVSLSLLSIPQAGPNIRNVELLITDGHNLSTATLQNMKLSLAEFKALALSPDDAQRVLLRALQTAEKQGAVLCGLRNTRSLLSSLSTMMPRLFEAVSRYAIIDPLLLTKQHTLPARSDEVMPLFLKRNGGKPIYFSDTPGSILGIRGLLSGETTRILSNDEKYAMSLDDETVYIHDYTAGTHFKWGARKDLSLLLHSSQMKANAQHVSGAQEAMLQDTKVRYLLAVSKPTTPIELVQFITSSTLMNSLVPQAQQSLNTLEANWEGFQRRFDFSLSLSDNLERLSPLLTQSGLSLSQTLAGGVGGQKGNRFLQRLYKQSSAYFWAATTGKKIDTQTLLTKENPALPLSAKDASLTVADVLRANFTAFQTRNPTHVNHHQLHHHASSLLSRLEPNTARPPSKAINALSQEYGIPATLIRQLYNAAYQDKEKQAAAGLFDDFIPRANMMDIGAPGPALSAWLFSLRITDKLPGNNLNERLKKHIIAQTARSTMLSLHRVVAEEAVVVTTPFTTSKQLDCHIVGTNGPVMPDIPVNDIETVATLMHLQNGAAQIKEMDLPERVINEVEELFLNTLRSPKNNAALQRVNDYLTTHGVEAEFRPNDAALQRFGETLLIAAVTGGSPPPFNRHFNEAELAMVKQKAQDTVRLLGPLGLVESTQASSQKISDLTDNAALQFKISSFLLSHVKKDKRGFLSDDKTTLKGRHIERSRELGIPFFLTDTVQVTRALLHALYEHLPPGTRMELTHFIEQQEMPKQGSEAKRIYQEILNVFRLPPNLISREGPVARLSGSFEVKNISPIESLMDSPSHARLLEGATPPSFCEEKRQASILGRDMRYA